MNIRITVIIIIMYINTNNDSMSVFSIISSNINDLFCNNDNNNDNVNVILLISIITNYLW